jgi:hypothetical protein
VCPIDLGGHSQEVRLLNAERDECNRQWEGTSSRLEAMSMEGLTAQRRWDAKDAPPADPATPEHPGRVVDTSSTVNMNTAENINTSPSVLFWKGLGAAGAKALSEKRVAQQFGSPEPPSPLRYEHEPSAADEAYIAQLMEDASLLSLCTGGIMSLKLRAFAY